MTAVATISQGAPRPVPAAPVNWDAELHAASMLVKSGLVPKDIRTPEAALFCILAGRDLGMSPVQSLRSIRPVQGKLEVSADAQLGLFVREGGRFAWTVLNDTVATIELFAPWLVGSHKSTFTIEDAKRAKLTSNPVWTSYPKAMLRSRTITQGLKDVGFLQGSGVYAPGELSGYDKVTVDLATGEVLSAEVVDDTPAAPAVPTLPGKPTAWGGNGGKPITEVPTSVLAAAGKWMTKNDAEKFADLITAIEEELIERHVDEGEAEEAEA